MVQRKILADRILALGKCNLVPLIAYSLLLKVELHPVHRDRLLLLSRLPPQMCGDPRAKLADAEGLGRSEERRVGKECRL